MAVLAAFCKKSSWQVNMPLEEESVLRLDDYEGKAKDY